MLINNNDHLLWQYSLLMPQHMFPSGNATAMTISFLNHLGTDH